MLHIYGTPLSSPTNKVRYTANYLNIPFEFHLINLATGEHRSPTYLQINPYGRVPAINDDGFKLAESNAIIRYLADKNQSPIYPKELKQRAVVDQWIDFASVHVMLALSRIMFNTYFYKFANTPIDERSLQDGKKFIAQYLPIIENQLARYPYISGELFSLADIVLLSALDTAELSKIDLHPFSSMSTWRKKLMQENFYTECHDSYTVSFNKILEKVSV